MDSPGLNVPKSGKRACVTGFLETANSMLSLPMRDVFLPLKNFLPVRIKEFRGMINASNLSTFC